MATLTECLPGIWAVNMTPFFPVAEIRSLLVSAEEEENVGLPQGFGVAHIILGPPA
ncbi:MAG: hypothetical protein ACM3XZ_03325 [Betaproteobacteria bacterium]